MISVPNNCRVDTFPDPVGHFGAHWRPFWILQAVRCCRPWTSAASLVLNSVLKTTLVQVAMIDCVKSCLETRIKTGRIFWFLIRSLTQYKHTWKIFMHWQFLHYLLDTLYGILLILIFSKLLTLCWQSFSWSSLMM